MNLNKKSLTAIAWLLLEYAGKREILHLRNTGEKTANEIDSFVFNLTGHRMDERSKIFRYKESLKKKLMQQIEENYEHPFNWN